MLWGLVRWDADGRSLVQDSRAGVSMSSLQGYDPDLEHFSLKVFSHFLRETSLQIQAEPLPVP